MMVLLPMASVLFADYLDQVLLNADVYRTWTAQMRTAVVTILWLGTELAEPLNDHWRIFKDG
eukprot:776313-Ditylum_brightwellii.AAC.2